MSSAGKTIWLCVVTEESFKDGEQWVQLLGEYYGKDAYDAMRWAVKGLEQDLIDPVDGREIVFKTREEPAGYLGIGVREVAEYVAEELRPDIKDED